MIDRTYLSLVKLAAYELGRITLIPGLTCPTDLDYDDCQTVIMIVARKKKKKKKTRDDRIYLGRINITPWTGRKDIDTDRSLLTEAEVVAMLDSRPTTIPIDQAVRVLSRTVGPGASAAFEDFYSGKVPDLPTEDEILELIRLDNYGVAKLLRALLSLIDDYKNSGNHVKEIRYENLYKDDAYWGSPNAQITPIRAGKIVRSLGLVLSVAASERDALLASLSLPKVAKPEVFRLSGKSTIDEYYEAADKVIGKACLAGVSSLSTLIKAKAVYESQH